ncbi:MAG: PD-(D/E)XK nuclease family protein [Bacteroidota bacterium]
MPEINKMVLESLLNRVKLLIDHKNEVERLKGEQFNIFSILKMETSENATHSAFLSALLDPLSTHGYGNLFLSLFLEEIGVDSKEFDLSSASVSTEYFIGKVNYDMNVGGRIDILIRDAYQNSICIENKIYAGDQQGQNASHVCALWPIFPLLFL